MKNISFGASSFSEDIFVFAHEDLASVRVSPIIGTSTWAFKDILHGHGKSFVDFLLLGNFFLHIWIILVLFLAQSSIIAVIIGDIISI